MQYWKKGKSDWKILTKEARKGKLRLEYSRRPYSSEQTNLLCISTERMGPGKSWEAFFGATLRRGAKSRAFIDPPRRADSLPLTVFIALLTSTTLVPQHRRITSQAIRSWRKKKVHFWRNWSTCWGKVRTKSTNN